MATTNPAVVASLTDGSINPFSCISLSPSREFAIAAAKDTLHLIRIDPGGISSLRKLKISQYFQTSVTTEHRSQVGKMYGDVRDTFKLGMKQAPHSHAGNSMTHGNVTITAVAWSPPQAVRGKSQGGEGGEESKIRYNDSLVAAAGSNGVIAVWNANQAFFSEGSGESSTLANQHPEAILSQEHTRAVNSLAWHPKRSGVILTASQDSTVKLWERREVAPKKGREHDTKKRFGLFNMTQNQGVREYSWFCRSTFEPKSEAVREIQWSKFQDDVFALVTVSGSLVIYSMHVSWKSIVKIAAHAGDATSLDWHPTRPYVIATGGSGDRCVKVWDVESSVNMKAEDTNASGNNNTWNTTKSEMSTTSNSSNDTERSSPSTTSGFGNLHSNLTLISSNARNMINTQAPTRYKFGTDMMQHVITIASSVTKVRWRPPASEEIVFDSKEEKGVDRHDSIFAVATARLTSAGGSGVISLWSTHRPFMPLSIVEGHEEGAVADFVWMQTPRHQADFSLDQSLSKKPEHQKFRRKNGTLKSDDTVLIRSGSRGDVESILFDSPRDEEDRNGETAIWQHIVSVGRDGKCILQSFVRGDRPISRVPSSCFAMANLSPFQRGYGSLQIFSVHQQVPNGVGSDFDLTALRQDNTTAKAPGVFKETPIEVNPNSAAVGRRNPALEHRLPERTPELIFNIVDQGPLDENGLPAPADDDEVVCVAPEVVHLSRFASSYKLYPDDEFPTRVELCLHNAVVAEDLRCEPLARMWRSVASMLSGSGLDELRPKGMSQPSNVMYYVLLPTIKSLLLERAEAGDVQTCVALCEVLQVVEADNDTRIPGLELNIVREWYLAYIDLLQQMCLFTSATFLIKNSLDPFIAALNQQSTTIHESCPRCGKAIQPSSSSPSNTSGIRACQNCRRMIGLCFLCHEPVKGVFVWCPGCGHGGHLEHALQWFGGSSENTVREMCPTGCGHRCNLVQSVSAFPRTDSLRCLPTFDSNADVGVKPVQMNT